MLIHRAVRTVSLAVMIGSLTLGAQQPSHSPVTDQDLVAGLKNPARWLTFSGNYNGQRHSPLTQVTPQNVTGLAPRWIFQTEVAARGRGFETTPIVADGVMYITGNANTAWAIDARTGREIWRYRRTLPDLLRVCCGQVNRGFGILGDLLYMGTLDAHLIALDRKTGAVVWDVTVEEPRNGYAITVAPLVVQDKVIVGAAGGDFATR